ncbi:MAG: cyclodeaminase/cyclohydrolase family protein [Gallionella sp.]
MNVGNLNLTPLTFDPMNTHTQLLAKPTTELLSEFGAGKASLGSGSAAALMGLLSCRLIITVCTKSLEKQELKKEHNNFVYVMNQASGVIYPKLTELFEKDARDFDEVVRLRILRDKATNTNTKSQFSRQANDLLETATNNSFEIIEQCFKLVDHGIVVFSSGWHAVRGDSGAAISAGIAGVTSGIFIANLNLKMLKDRKFAAEKIARCDELYKELTYKQMRAFECVTSLNSEAISAIQLERATQLELIKP